MKKVSGVDIFSPLRLADPTSTANHAVSASEPQHNTTADIPEEALRSDLATSQSFRTPPQAVEFTSFAVPPSSAESILWSPTVIKHPPALLEETPALSRMQVRVVSPANPEEIETFLSFADIRAALVLVGLKKSRSLSC